MNVLSGLRPIKFEKKPSVFERYAGTVDPEQVMSSEEASSLGLPTNGDARQELVDKILGFRRESDKHRTGDPTKGFGFAIASVKIMRGERQGYIIPDSSGNSMIRPFILRRGTDNPLWKGFQAIFPRVLKAQGLIGVEKVPSLKSIDRSKDPVDLALGFGKLLVAQSMEEALKRHSVLAMYDTNPADHVIVTFEDVNPTLVHPVLKSATPTETA